MRLGISNLAWSDPSCLDGLAALGFAGIEVAPTRIAPWDALGSEALLAYRETVEARGMQICSLQAIFYGVAGAQLLGCDAAFGSMGEHLRRVAEIASTLGAAVAVFGAPKNRLRRTMPTVDAAALAAERLRVLGDIAAEVGLTLGIEPVPSAYGGDFLERASDVLHLVRIAAHPAVRVHLDTACVLLGGDRIAVEIARSGPLLAHFHAQEPQMGDFSVPRAEHGAAGAALRELGYAGWVVIEMAEQREGWGAVEKAAAYARTAYGAEPR